MKTGLNASAKRFDAGQPALSAQAVLRQNFLPTGKFSTCQLTSVLQDSVSCNGDFMNALPFPKQVLVFTCLQYKYLETLWEKDKLLVTSIFPFSNSVFYPFGDLFIILSNFKIVLGKLDLSVWESLSFGTVYR